MLGTGPGTLAGMGAAGYRHADHDMPTGAAHGAI